MRCAELTEDQESEVAAEVNSVMNEWWGIWAGDADIDFERGLTFILDEPETGWVNDGQFLSSKAALVDAFRPFFAVVRRQIITPLESRTVVLARSRRADMPASKMVAAPA